MLTRIVFFVEIPLLHQQVKHKLDFILKYVPKNVELYLLGHSIGSYIILQILQKLITENNYNVKQCFLLFPTIERMADTPNGQRFVKASSWGFHYIPYLLSYVTFYLPDSVKEYLIKRRLSSSNLSTGVLEGAKQLFHWSVISNMIWMALDEMKIVKQLDVELLRTFHDKLTIFYGTTDEWCPLSYCTNVEKLLNGTQTKIVVCDPSVEHAFVISNAITVSDIICEMVIVSE